MFQSTPPRGGRHRRIGCQAVAGIVFQSTPPRGGRHHQTLSYGRCQCFNPRPRVGGDLDTGSALHDQVSVSIHAPAWGATHDIGPSCLTIEQFQSTPPRGGRHQHCVSTSNVSIHAPAWGATRDRCHIGRRCFNPRPRVGGDRSGSRFAAVIECFNPRPRVGGDIETRCD